MQNFYETKTTIYNFIFCFHNDNKKSLQFHHFSKYETTKQHD